MRRYVRLFEMERNSAAYLTPPADDAPIVERINSIIGVVRERYETLEYLRKGKQLSNYLPTISEPIEEDFQEFTSVAEGVGMDTELAESPAYHLDLAKSQDYELWAGILVPSVKELNQHIQFVYENETAGFQPPLAYSVWCMKGGKVYDFAVGTVKKDIAYIGKKVEADNFDDGESLMRELQSWFR